MLSTSVLFPFNPTVGFDSPKAGEPQRDYLTFEEVKALTEAECRYPVLKRAFLFSCLTGLRWSDIQKLRWKDIQDFNGIPRIVFRQKKTNGQEYLDINPQAMQLIGERREDQQLDDRVFVGLQYSSCISLEINKWCMRAGITKNIPFHCARHTFAVMMIELGTEIYTVKELLGHKQLRTTEIYAKVLDKRKQAAVGQIPQLLPTEKRFPSKSPQFTREINATTD